MKDTYITYRGRGPKMRVVRIFRSIWLQFRILTGLTPRPLTVLLHDPASAKPKDLDNPFLDPEAQRRVGAKIAGAVSGRDVTPPQMPIAPGR